MRSATARECLCTVVVAAAACTEGALAPAPDASDVAGQGGGGSGGGVGGTGGRGGSGGRTGSSGGATGGSGGRTGGSGGSADAATPPSSGSGGAGGSPGASTGPLVGRIGTASVTIPAGVEAAVSNQRVWGRGSLGVAPVFVAPLADCGALVCYTTGGAAGAGRTARVARIGRDDTLVRTFDLGAFQCRGLAAEPDGHFAALLWDDAADAIHVRRYDIGGAMSWSRQLVNSDNTPTDFGIGEGRLEYGNGRYGAYYHVHSTDGHEGDTLKWVAAATGVESTEWAWGCSHSMSNLLRFNPTGAAFLSACVTDCFPGTSGTNFATSSKGGIYVNRRQKVMDLAAGCNGNVGGELGGAAPAPSGWKLLFNGHQAPTTLGQQSYDKTTMNQDIGFATISASFASSPVVWLTSTPSINEADSSIIRWQPEGDPAEQYLVGWSEPGPPIKYKLGRVDGSGVFLEGPHEVSPQVRWGRRDDPFRRHANGDVVWAWFDGPGATSLRLARVRSGTPPMCTPFPG